MKFDDFLLLKCSEEELIRIFFPFIFTLEIVITRAAPAFHKLFLVMACVFDINTVHKTVEKLTSQAFY